MEGFLNSSHHFPCTSWKSIFPSNLSIKLLTHHKSSFHDQFDLILPQKKAAMEDLIINLNFLLICNITNLFREFLCCCFLIIQFAIKLVIQDESFVDEEDDEDETLPPGQRDTCSSHELTYDDIKVVMSRIGMPGWRSDEVVDGGEDGECKECGLMEGIHTLLEEKEASLEELEEAFYVFDRNEDGFISTEELWNVLRRLGFEGISLGDCERMITVFDDDGDGRINFREFKSLLEISAR